MQKINLKLFDIDGCLYRYDYERIDDGPYRMIEIKGTPIENWLLKANKELFTDSIAEIKKARFDKVILGYGTNRQSRDIDAWNAEFNELDSLAPALPLVQSHFQNQLDCPVVIDPLLLADIYGSRKNGESYEAILKEKYKKMSSLKHAFTMFDHTKVSLIYTFIHRTATLHPDAQIVADFYDDKHDAILQPILQFFTRNPDLLPRNTTLNLFDYDGRIHRAYKVEGKGDIDTHYDWSLRYLCSKTYFLTNGPHQDRKIKTAEELKKYHEEDHYHAKDHAVAMQIGGNFDVDDFKKFRETEVVKLPSNTTANYHTAIELHDQGLLPKKYVVLPGERENDRHYRLMLLPIRLFISHCGKVNDSNAKFNWSTFFRHSPLTKRFMLLANEFLQQAEDIRNPSELLIQTQTYQQKMLEIMKTVKAKSIGSKDKELLSCFEKIEKQLLQQPMPVERKLAFA